MSNKNRKLLCVEKLFLKIIEPTPEDKQGIGLLMALTSAIVSLLIILGIMFSN